MKKYWVTCQTISYGSYSVLIEAKNKTEAKELGEQDISCGLGEENHSQMEIQETEVTEE